MATEATRVTVLDGSEDGSELRAFVEELQAHLGEGCRVFTLARMDIRFCTGCWSCWWRTPGRCIFRDDMDAVLPAFLESDVLVIASPTELGLPSAALKKAMDRTIPLVHPYVELHHGESHHRKRYAHYPDLALLVPSTRSADGDRLGVWIERYARNLHGSVVLRLDLSQTPQEVAHALARS